MNRIALSESFLLRRLLVSRGFRMTLQIIFLLATFALIARGWGLYAPAGVESKLFAKSNLVTLLIWGIWWPSMILVAVLFGRAWCAVCPLELLNRAGERLSGLMGLRGRPLPRWMRSGWMILLLYAAIQMLIASAHLHRVPMYTALYLAGMAAIALLAGVLFRDRAYCRGLCPVGMLLKVYGRGGALAVRPRENVDGTGAGLARHCRSKLAPAQLHRQGGEDCLMCMDCVRADQGRTRMQLVLRWPWTRSDRRLRTASWPVTAFIMMLSGFVAYEIAGFWTETRSIFLYVPNLAADRSGVDAGVLKGLWVLGVFPVLLWSLSAFPSMVMNREQTIGQLWRRMAYPASLIIAALHMTKAMEKLSTWSGYIPQALRDPSGGSAGVLRQGAELVVPAPLPGNEYILTAGLLLLCAAILLIRRERSPQPSFNEEERSSEKRAPLPESCPPRIVRGQRVQPEPR